MVPYSHLFITTFFAVIVYSSSDKILPVPVYFLHSLNFNRYNRRDASLNLFFSSDCTYPPYSKMVMLVLAPLMLSLYITSTVAAVFTTGAPMDCSFRYFKLKAIHIRWEKRKNYLWNYLKL